MNPRISFSKDFVETHQQIMKQERSSTEAPVMSSDFEFSVSNYSMMSADELFFKGKLLPFKENCSNQMQRTLREELLVDDDDDDDNVTLRPQKGSTMWKGFLGLKRTHNIGSKKADKTEGSVGTMADTKSKNFTGPFERKRVKLQRCGDWNISLHFSDGITCRNVEHSF